MSSRAFISSLLAASLALSSLAPLALASGSEDGTSSELDRQYDDLIEAEKARHSKESLTERLASGLAALGIGLYGYYNDNHGLLIKVVYSATQTAGIVMVSNAILDANEPSLLLLTDRYLNRRNKQMDLEKFKKGIVLLEERRAVAEAKQLAYTSGMLSAMYGYNAFRETQDVALKNVFYFLSFNFALISVANFYRLATHDFAPAASGAMERRPRVSYEVAVLPVPTVTVHF